MIACWVRIDLTVENVSLVLWLRLCDVVVRDWLVIMMILSRA